VPAAGAAPAGAPAKDAGPKDAADWMASARDVLGRMARGAGESAASGRLVFHAKGGGDVGESVGAEVSLDLADLVVPPPATVDAAGKPVPDEPLRLAATCAVQDGLVTVHLRNEGPGLMDSLDEMLGIARETGCRLQIAHLKCIGNAHWGRADRVLERVATAAEQGIDVAYDVYPYTAGSRHLYGSLPNWVVDGGVGPMVERLRQPEVRARLRESLNAWAEGLDSGGGFSLDFPNTMITSVRTDDNAWCVGKRLDEIAEQRGQDPLDATLDLLIEEQAEVSCVLWAMAEDDVREFLKHPLGCIATDGLAYAPYGPLSEGAPHPRCYGTYARFLGRYVRDEGLLPIEAAIRKCTSLPASRLHLSDRGTLAEGYRADVVVFDPDRIAERGDFGRPHAYPEGIDLVIVNGHVAALGAETTHARYGTVIRSH